MLLVGFYIIQYLIIIYLVELKAVYLSSVVKLPKNKKVYVIGEAGIEEELAEEGYRYLGGTVLYSQLYTLSS